MSYRDRRVLMVAWVEPTLRERARGAARLAGLDFSHWVARAMRQAMERESVERAIALAKSKLECGTCGHAPCGCDQQ